MVRGVAPSAAEIRGLDGAVIRVRTLMDEDDFTPRLGRIRHVGSKKERTFLSRVIAAANLARGGAVSAGTKKSGFTGSRIGRGVGVGRVLAARDRHSFLRQRRVIIKSRIVRLAGKGFAGARAHLRYLQRDGVTREGTPGRLYEAASDEADGKAFLERGADDRHQFRFIVSAEDGAAYSDLKPLTRRLMAQMEEDLGTRLDWVAVDHFNTGYPHSHIIVRGIDDRGRDLVIARDYLTSGMRERAAELVRLDLGPRSDSEIEERLRAEVSLERLTSIDRQLLQRADEHGEVTPNAGDPFRQSVETGRLRFLARMGLAEEIAPRRWRLAENLEATLREIGMRGDILNTLHRALAEQGLQAAASDRQIFDPARSGAPLVGQVLARGLADELADRHYLIVEGVDGRSHYVDIGKGDGVEPLPQNAIVRIDGRQGGIREVDHKVVEIAAANDGLYDVEAHLRHDPRATQSFAESHIRRLEAIRRRMGSLERRPDGRWKIAPDHLERVAAFEARQARDRPVTVAILSPLPLEQLSMHDGATWLDRELAASEPFALRDAGFGRAVSVALGARRQWLIEQGLMRAAGLPAPDLVRTLERREIARVADVLSDRLGLRFAEVKRGDTLVGTLRQRVDLASGRYALVENSREFSLVPWRPVLEGRIGQAVSGVAGGGGIDWAFARTRSGPSIS